MAQNFPDRYPLNGSDYFQVFLDRHHRRYSHKGNVSRLALVLGEKPDLSELEKRLNAIPFLLWMISLRLKTSWVFRLPYWQVESSDTILIKEHIGDFNNITACQDLFNEDIDAIKQAPLNFQILSVNKQTVLVLSWNHILMDARGAEIIIAHIANNEEITFFATNNFPEENWKKRLAEIRRVKDFLVPRVQAGIRLIQPEKIRRSVAHRVINISKSQTEEIDVRLDHLKVGLTKSSYYLAAVQTAFHCVTGGSTLPSWIPVPQDQRRKGQWGPVMSNQVSFLFYSLESKDSKLTSGISSIRDQMMNQMRDRLPASYHIMMDSMRRFPSWLYRHLIASPTNGALASFFYSDTGNSLENADSIHDCPLVDATHYPPNSGYPGLTIIFMRFGNRQKVIYSYPDDEFCSKKMDRFEEVLTAQLLGYE